MEELKSGNTAKLEIVDQEGSRWILKGDDEDLMMNVSDADEDIVVGDTVHVFLYANRRGELTATMNMPNMTNGTYGWAKVLRIDDKEGVYVDIGSSFEVLVNGNDMPKVRALWPKIGDELYLTLRTDLGGQIFGRLATEERVIEQITEATPALLNRNLKARAYRLLPVGSFMLSIPENYRIFIHNSEQEREPRLGQEMDVRIIGIRDDRTVTLFLIVTLISLVSRQTPCLFQVFQQDLLCGQSHSSLSDVQFLLHLRKCFLHLLR